jgi:hypothetical protein
LNRAICTTTINSPSKALIDFCQLKEWDLIVALDVNSKPFDLSGCHILTPEFQEKMAPSLSQAIGFKSIQRRNFATLFALQSGYETIAFVDDDNIPKSNWSDLASQEKFYAMKYATTGKYFDPLSVIPAAQIYGVSHRGIPITHYAEESQVTTINRVEVTPDVVAMLWDGDWDVNAIDRLHNPCNGNLDVSEPFFSDELAPFNSQNTVMSAEAAKNFFIYPFIGRFDDILASYVLRIAGFSCVYTPPTVTQIRNTHSLKLDIDNEVWGYCFMQQIVDALLGGRDLLDLSELPDSTKRALEEWRKLIDRL